MNFNLDKLSDILYQMKRLAEMDVALAQVEAEAKLKAQLKAESTVEPKVERPKRCQMADCKAKLVLSDFACQCKGFYCSKHRHSELHACSFDYKAASNKLLEKGLVKTVADKLERI